MTWFEALCAERHERGVQEYRGGNFRAPFDGDPLACLIEEYADAANYLIEFCDQDGWGRDPSNWPVGYQNQWNTIRDLACWTRLRMKERDTRRDGGIDWAVGNVT